MPGKRLFGSCCGCGTEAGKVRTAIMLDKLCPIPGRGWGCVVCDLPSDGAVAVFCDPCAKRIRGGESVEQVAVWACRGYPGSDGRVLYSELEGAHLHDMTRHEPDEDY